MTKKELKQIEEAKREMNILRYKLVDAYVNFHGDLDAYERVNKINGETMTDEIRQRVLGRYSILEEYGYSINMKDAMDETIRSAIYQIVKTEREYKGYNKYAKFEKGIGPDTLVYDETFPSSMKMVVLIKYATIFGFDKLIYARNSIDAISDLVEMGCKVVDTNRKINGDGGLVLDITDTNLVMFVCKLAEKEKKELITHNAEWNKETPQEDIDKINEKYIALTNLIKK